MNNRITTEINSDREKRMDHQAFYLLILPIIFIIFGQTLIKLGAIRGAGFFNIFVLVGYICLIMRGWIWIFIIRKIKLSTAYPVLSLTYIFILLISRFLFDERITRFNIVGTVLIITGIAFLGIGETSKLNLMGTHND